MGHALIARANVVHAGKTQAVFQCNVFIVSRGEEVPCAVALGLSRHFAASRRVAFRFANRLTPSGQHAHPHRPETPQRQAGPRHWRPTPTRTPPARKRDTPTPRTTGTDRATRTAASRCEPSRRACWANANATDAPIEDSHIRRRR